MTNSLIDCTEARSELPLFVGGDLEAETQQRVADHLEGCTACRAFLDRARSAREALVEDFTRSARDEARPEVWSGVRAGLLEAGLVRSRAAVPAPGAPANSRSSWGVLRWVPVAAAAGALFYCGTWFGSGVVPERGGPERAPREADPGALVEVLHPAPAGLQPVEVEAGEPLAPLDPAASMLYEAQPWMGGHLPLVPHGGAGASAASFVPRQGPRADGVR